MKLFGTCTYYTAINAWEIETEPHVSIRLKRWFPKIDSTHYGKKHRLKATPENCLDLQVFLQRYPMDVRPSEHFLEERANEHKERMSLVDRFLRGEGNDRVFPLKLPPREYQGLAANMWLTTGGLLLADDVGLGKAQPLSSLVLTPTGWATMGSLKVGQEVVDPDTGEGAYVEGVYPQGTREVYRVTTKDGASTLCCGEHLWTVQNSNDRVRGGWRTLTTEELLPKLKWKKGNGTLCSGWFLPIAAPVVCSPRSLPIEPYLLGCLLGDGTFAKDAVGISSADQSLLQEVSSLLPPSICLRKAKSSKYYYRLSGRKDGYSNPLLDNIRELGLGHHRSWEKFIPSLYKSGSVEQRRELLAGLLDTDAECTDGGVVMFSSTSKRLAEDVAELVGFLGGFSSLRTRTSHYTYKGIKKVGRKSYTVNIRVLFNPFHLTKKASRWHLPLMARAIESIEKVGSQEVQCIKVSSKRQLYVTDGFIVTHNTCVAFCGFVDPKLRPALVVTLSHLPMQWASELGKFTDLRCHILKKGTPYDILDKQGRLPDVIISNYHKLGGWAETLDGVVKSVTFDECQELRHKGTQKYEAAKRIADGVDYRLGLSVGPESLLLLRGGCFGTGWHGPIEQAFEIVLGSGISVVFEQGYSLLPVVGASIEVRGWEADGFQWKPVKTFIRHGCDKPVRMLQVRGSKLTVTDDHSLFRINGGTLESIPSDKLAVNDILPLDNGRKWNDAAPLERVIDIPSIMPLDSKKTQVLVDLAGLTRHDLRLNAWQWQNLKQERKYGARLPLKVFLEHRAKLPKPTGLYFSQTKGKAKVVGDGGIRLSNWAYVLGFFLGGGWVNLDSKKRVSSVSFSVDLPHYRKLRLALGDIVETPIKMEEKKRSAKMVELKCHNTFFANAVYNAFSGKHRCWDKEIPAEWLTTWSLEAREKLLEGLVDSDGSRDGDNFNYHSTSKRLVGSVQILLTSLGVPSSYYECPLRDGGLINGRRIKGRRTSYLALWSAGTDHRGQAVRYKPAELWAQAPIKGIEAVVAPKFVYDLEVEGHHSFTVGNSSILGSNSATPIYNYGGEIWNVCNVISPDALGTWEEFSREWCEFKGQKYVIPDPPAFGVYARETGVMLRRTRKEVKRELPGVIRVPQWIQSDPEAFKKLKGQAIELAKLILRQTQDFKGQKMQAAGEFDMKMRQATGISKAPFVADFVRFLVEENGTPVVLYGWHRDVYEIWLEKLRGYPARGIADLNPVMYTGSESPAQKEWSKQEFLSGRSKVMMISLRAGAGMDGLQEVCHVDVFGELDWSPGVHEQCEGRLHRDGQDEPVTSYYLLADNGSDPVMSDVLGVKTQQIEGILDPNRDLVQQLQIDPQHIRKLAEKYLTDHGVPLPQPDPPKNEEEVL